MSVRVITGDCRDVLASLPAESVHAIVTDPPYHLTANKKGGSGVASINLESPYGRSRIGTGNGPGGFMGKVWDGGDIAFRPDVWKEAFRVLKPGAHLLAFGGTRTYHRLACAIEDAGFEIRDQIQWIYGSGFPKSHDVSKAIDRAAGAEREVVGRKVGRAATPVQDIRNGSYAGGNGKNGAMDCSAITAAATDAAREWEGWGTALKPAHEPIVLARKPLIGTVAANVAAHGTGAVNVDACRVGGTWARDSTTRCDIRGGAFVQGKSGALECDPQTAHPLGRWPANVIHDGSEEVLAGFPQADSTRASGNPNNPRHGSKDRAATSYDWNPERESHDYRDTGSAARFFYTAKADKDDRLKSKHPTVKPVDLMAYLVRLVTPPGGTVLDPFAGSGTTGMACLREGFDCILIEREAEYVADIERRIAHVSGHDAPLFAGAAE